MANLLDVEKTLNSKKKGKKKNTENCSLVTKKDYS